MMLSDVCLSVCLGLSRTSGLSREQRGPGRPKLSHVTRTPLSRSIGQRSRSPGRFTHRGVNASDSYSRERGNDWGVGTYCYVAVCRRFGAHRGRTGAGILWRPPSYSLILYQFRLSNAATVSKRVDVSSQFLTL